MQQHKYLCRRWRKALHIVVCACVILSSLLTIFTLAPPTVQAAVPTDTEGRDSPIENIQPAPVAHAPNAPVAGRLNAPIVGANPGEIQGIVFQDYNSNGVMDTAGDTTNPAIDRGVAGVTVTVYDATGAQVGVATSDATGAYTITGLLDGAACRVEFSNLPAGYDSSFQGSGTGTTSGTSVQFVTGGSGNVSFGVNRPCDYCQQNPDLATSQYYKGNKPTQINATIVGFPYSAGSSTSVGYNNPTTPLFSTALNKVGTTWGLGYARERQQVYAAAFFKRHSQFGPGADGAQNNLDDPGAIYVIDQNTGNVVSTFSVTGVTTNAHDVANYDSDNGNTGWDAVGKTALGGLDLSDDDQTLYVMDVQNRRLVALNAVTGAQIAAVNVPTTGVPTQTTCASSDVRPFAVEYYHGVLYFGMVCSAESTGNVNDLWAYVYTADPTTLAVSAAPVFSAPLNYPRGQGNDGAGQAADWNPWTPTYRVLAGRNDYPVYPQPMLTGLTFDNDRMTLGLRDRFTDQVGNGNLSQEGTTNRPNGIQAGDILQVCQNNASQWTLESNGLCDGRGTSGNPNNSIGQGPGNGEFYYEDDFSTPHNSAKYHDEVSSAGVVQVPGFPHVAVTVFDPVPRQILDSTYDGGVRWFNNRTGALDKSYLIYDGAAGSADNQFGKSGGMGDLVALCDPAPIEIGNRVWDDLDRDGVQDAGELGLPNVTVVLTDEGGNSYTTVTNADGAYYFNESNTPGVLQPNRAYTLTIDTTQPALDNFVLTGANTAGANTLPDGVDSDATPNGVQAQITLSTGSAGQNDHTFDFGFSKDLLSLGNRVWFDTNNDGLDNDGAGGTLGTGVAHVTLQLLDAGGAVLATTLTDGAGYYRFDDLNAGDYRVVVAAANFASGGVLANYRNSTPTANDPTDANDNGTPNGTLGSGGDVRSALITLDNTPPTGEISTGGGVNAPLGDAYDDLTVDFGFYKLTLGNRVWIDANRDGVDGMETGAANVPVTLTTSLGAVVATTTTDANGYYTFTNLISDTYLVQIQAPTYFISTSPDDTTNNINLNDNGLGGAGGLISSGPIPLTPGVVSGEIRVNDSNGHTRNQTIDFGIYQPVADLEVFKSVEPPTYTLGTSSAVTYTFVITNFGPSPVANAPVTDTQPANVTFDSWNCTIQSSGSGSGTNACGAANGSGDILTIVSLRAGAAAIWTINATISSAATGTLVNTVREALPPGMRQDIINRQDSDIASVQPQQPLFSVGNRIWFDTNDDGATTGPGVAEPVPTVLLELVDRNTNTIVQTIQSGANGYYRFDNVPAGDYEIVVAASNFQVGGALEGYRNSSGVTITTTNTLYDNYDHGINSPVTLAVAGAHSVPFSLGIGLQPTGETAVGGGADGPHGDSNSNLTIDFGFNRQQAGNQLWYDTDNDGVYEPGDGEQPLPAGVVVVLHAIIFGVDTAALTTTTDANGQYLFLADNNTDLNTLIADVYVAIPPGQPALNSYVPSTGVRHDGGGVDNENTGALDATGVITSGLFFPVAGSTANGAVVNDALGQTYQPTIDFGFVRESYTLGNRVWLDTNDNGIFDANEIAVPAGTRLELRDSSGDILTTTMTNASGYYSFTNLPAGTYEVAVAASNFVGLGAGYQNSTNTTAPSTNVADDNRDHGINVAKPGVDSIRSGPITLGPGLQPTGEGDGTRGPEGDANDNMTIDFGFYRMVVGNLVWNDNNNDGIYDSATESGVADVHVRIYATNGVTRTEIPVGPDGAWGTADDALGGIRTDSNGFYEFSGLISGTYSIEIDLPEGYVSSTGINASTLGPYEPPPDPDTNLDHDDNGYYEDRPSRIAHSEPFTLIPGYSGSAGNTVVLDLAGTTTDYTVDFGIFHDLALGNLIWDDLDNDGLWDSGVESGIDGVQVNLYYDANGDGDVDDAGETTPISTTVTAGGGLYLFTYLPPGNYLVELDASNFNPGGVLENYTSSTGLNGGVTGPYETAPDPDATGVDNDDNGSISGGLGSGGAIRSAVFNLEEGDEPTNENPDNEPFRLDTNENLTIDFGVFRYASLGNYTWIDLNKDGVQDAAEPPLAGVSVQLFTAADVLVATTSTDVTGHYLFTNLLPDDYYVVFTPPTDFTITQQNAGDDTLDSDADSTTGIAATTTLVLDEYDDSWDAGFISPLAIGNLVWYDANHNSMVDSSEHGLPSVAVELYQDSNGDGIFSTGDQLISTTNTSASGFYSFTNLAPTTGISTTYLVVITGTNFANGGVLQNYQNSNGTVPLTNTLNSQDNGIDGTLNATIGFVASRVITLTTSLHIPLPTDDGDNSPSGSQLTGPFTGVADNLPHPARTNWTVDFGFVAWDRGDLPNATTATNSPAYSTTVADGGPSHIIIDGLRIGATEDGELDGQPTANAAGDDATGAATDDEDGIILPRFIPGQPATVVANVVNTSGVDAYLYGFIDFNGDGDFDDAGEAVTRVVPGDGSVTSVVLTFNVPANADGSQQIGARFRLSSDDTLTANGPARDGEVEDYLIQMQPILGALGNYVWLDEDADGEQDAGESGIPNVVVTLVDNNGTPYTTTTDSQGGYLFDDLPKGIYTVSIPARNFASGGALDGMEQTPLTGGDADLGNKDDAGYPIDLDWGEENLTADFGYNPLPADDVNNGTGLAALGDHVWIDSDGDGVQDPHEVPVAGVVLTLYSDPDGNGVYDSVIATDTTDANGYYLFDNLPAGSYVVRVTDSATASHAVLDPARYTQTGDPDHFAMPGSNNDNSSTIPVVLAPGDLFLNVDFGYQPQATAGLNSVGDTLWFDADADGNGPSQAPVDGGAAVTQGAGGAADSTDYGIAGVTVALIKDTNGNGLYDPGEPIIATDVTDANGQYLFAGLPDGKYIVQVTDTNNVLAGLKPTWDQDNGLVAPDQTSAVDLDSAGTDPASVNDRLQDFGYTPAEQQPNSALLGDTIYFDPNRNGTQEPGESGIEGVVMLLTDSNGIIRTTTTDENGHYAFAGLDPNGLYTVTSAPVNFAPGGVLAGMDNTGDPDGGNDSQSVTDFATPGSDGNADPDGTDNNVNLGQDFGYAAPVNSAGRIGNLVWLDSNANGTFDGVNGPDGIANTDDDERVIGGVTVDLYRDLNGNGLIDAGEPKLASTVTVNTIGTGTHGTDGNYIFEALPAGAYIVDVTDANHVLAGYWQSDGPNDDVNNNSQTDAYAVTIGGNNPLENLTADFGYYVEPAAVGNYVWADSNANGSQDDGETGINGVQVTLLITYPNGTAISVTTVTTNDSSGNPGYYSFGNLLLDEDQNGDALGAEPIHTIMVDPNQPALVNYTESVVDVNNNGSDKLDSDEHSGVLAQPVQGQTDTSAKEPATNEGTIASYDFGYYAPVSLGDYVWLDKDGDGQQDSNEPGLAGVTVTLRAKNGVVITTTTDVNGAYTFIQIMPNATYVVTFILPNSYHFTTLNVGNDNSDSDVPTSGMVVVTLGMTDNLTIDAGLVQSMSVGNYVWQDSNANGIQDAGESGIAGAVVALFKADGVTPAIDLNGNPVPTQTTGSDGLYNFGNLRPGDYVVRVTPPAGYTLTNGGADPDDDNNTDSNGTVVNGIVQSLPVTLINGQEPTNDGDTSTESNLSVDFGFYPPASIGSYAWLDTNMNGLKDVNEPGVGGVTVILYDLQGNVVATTVTNSDGLFQFTGLPPGDYALGFIPLTGYIFTLPGIEGEFNSDADPSTGRTVLTTLLPGENDPTWGSGFINAPTSEEETEEPRQATQLYLPLINR